MTTKKRIGEADTETERKKPRLDTGHTRTLVFEEEKEEGDGGEEGKEGQADKGDKRDREEDAEEKKAADEGKVKKRRKMIVDFEEEKS